MPAFVLVPASPSDLEAVARVQFAACASDPAFHTVFPNGPTLSCLTHLVQAYENEMDNDLTAHLMIVKEAMYGEVVSFSVWHFCPPTTLHEVDSPLQHTDFLFPSDANKDAGSKIMQNSLKKRQEVVANHIGHGRPYACNSPPFLLFPPTAPCPTTDSHTQISPLSARYQSTKTRAPPRSSSTGV